MSAARVGLMLDLSPEEARALAQFVKRLRWSDMRQCAEDDREAREIRDAVIEIQSKLGDLGIAPR